jgi:DNA-binding SARP family transcriptional activator
MGSTPTSVEPIIEVAPRDAVDVHINAPTSDDEREVLTAMPVEGVGRPSRGDSHTDATLQLLDGFVLRWDGEVVELPLGTQRLVAFLAIHGKPLLRTFVAGSLWLEKSEERSHANLRSTLWRLRQPVGELVQARGAHVRLTPLLTIDLHRAVDLARAGIGSSDLPSSEEIDLLMAGDLLPDWYDDWVVLERERLRQLRLNALESLCHQLTATRRYAAAVEVGLAAVAAEPLRETAHRALIVAHLAEGNRAEAMRQFQIYSDLIWEELGVGPSPQLLQAMNDWVYAHDESDARWSQMATPR